MNCRAGPKCTIAIFGATSDIAASVARRYARVGSNLVLVGRAEAALDAAAADLKVRGAPDVAVQMADFADLRTLPAVTAAAWDRFGGLDIALIAYGTLPDQSVCEQDRASEESALVLNFISPALLLDELALRFATQRRGTLAAISSVAGDRGRKSNYVYGAAKGGLQRYLEGLRHRLHASQVAVLDIRPGFISTKMTQHLNRKGPLWATPELVADSVVKAINVRCAVLYTPWFWRWIMTLIRMLPRQLLHRTSI